MSKLANVALPFVAFALGSPPTLRGDALRVAQLLGALGWIWSLFVLTTAFLWPAPGLAGALVAFLAVLWPIGYVKLGWETGQDPYGHRVLVLGIVGLLLGALQVLMVLTGARVSQFDVLNVAQAGLLLGVLFCRKRALRGTLRARRRLAR